MGKSQPVMFKRLLGLWHSFARLIGTVNTSILLFLLFFFVLTPTGLIMRLFRKSVFSRKESGSLWNKRSEEENLERQF